MVNIINIPDGATEWGTALRANLEALNTGVSIAETKASAAVNMASTRVRSVNGTFPNADGNVDVVITNATDQTARDAAAAAQQTADTAQSLATAKYSKPSGGIPGSDFAAGVQTSLSKADSAVQPGTLSAYIKTVNNSGPDANGNVTITVEGGGYIKPVDGIPSSDMTSAVQTSLGKADTALQSAPVTSVAGRTGAVTLTAADITNGASTWVPVTRSVATGTGLQGGGALSADRTLSLTSAAQASLAKADTAVQPGDASVTIGAWKSWSPAGYTSTAQYRLTPDGVQWRGQLTLTAGNHPVNTVNTVGTLPAEARPLDFTRLAWWMYGTVFAGLQINTTGVMTLTTGSVAGADFYLNGLNYAR